LNQKVKILLVTLIIGVVIAIIKAIAYFISGSVFILSDMLESGVNIFAGIIALASVYLASKPKDVDHPYGHGKVEFLSSGLEGVMIVIAGTLVIFKAIYSSFQPIELKNIDWGIFLSGLGGAVNLAMGIYLQREGKRINSIAIYSNGKHLLSDAYSSIAMILGLTLIYFTDYDWLDPVFAIIFGLVILYTGIKVVRKSVAGIMDEADEELITQTIAQIDTNRKDSWIDLHNFRIIKYGSSLHIDCHLTLPWYYSLKESHAEVEAFEKMVRDKSGQEVEVFVHADPCNPFSCEVCQLKECHKREKDFVRRIPWDYEMVVKNSKHKIKQN
jgi:cation diffusion facilitator family transporter